MLSLTRTPSFSYALTRFSEKRRQKLSATCRAVAVILSALTLTGCNSFSVIGNIPPNLLSECPDLPAPASGRSSEIMLHLVQTYGLYHECRAKHAALTGIVTK